MKKIAIEEHFTTEDYLNHLRSRKEYPKRDTVVISGKTFERDWWSATNFALIDPSLPNKMTDLGVGRLKDMDAAGIDMQVLSIGPSVEMFDDKSGVILAKNINDVLAGAVRQHPDRLAGFATIATQNPEAAAAELERAVRKLGLNGAMITGNLSGDYIDNERYWVIYEMAEKLNVPLYLHPKHPSPAIIQPFVYYPVLAAAMWGFGVEVGIQAMRLIVSGVFDKYPGLKIILGHLGEAIPFWLWRIDNSFRHSGGISREGAKKLQKQPSEYFKDNFYVTTSGQFWLPAFQLVFFTIGSDHILFAVDYPPESNERAVQFMESLPISEGDKEKIYHLNAEKLLGINPA